MSRAGVVTTIVTILLAGSWIAFELLTRTDVSTGAVERTETLGVGQADIDVPAPHEYSTASARDAAEEISSSIAPIGSTPADEIGTKVSTAPDQQMNRVSRETASESREREPASRENASPSRPESATGSETPSPTSDAMERTPSTENKPPVQEESDEDSDTTPPALERIWFQPSTVEAGGSTLLTANVRDDRAGVVRIWGRIVSPSSHASLSFSMTRIDAGLFQSTLTIPVHVEAGRWIIASIGMVDAANNRSSVAWTTETAPAEASLQIVSEDSDSTPPVIERVWLETPTAEAGNPARISVAVVDDHSGVRMVSGALQSPSGAAHLSFHSATGEAGLWSSEIQLPAEIECGEWSVSRVAAEDNAGNRSSVFKGDAPLEGAGLYVSFQGTCDSTPPELISVSIAPNVVSNRESSTIVVSALATDAETGVLSATVLLEGPDIDQGEPQRIQAALKRVGESNEWRTEVVIPRFSAAGRWTLRSLRLSDRARNFSSWSSSDPKLVTAWFMVE